MLVTIVLAFEYDCSLSFNSYCCVPYNGDRGTALQCILSEELVSIGDMQSGGTIC
jgi:hypothetical protein